MHCRGYAVVTPNHKLAYCVKFGVTASLVGADEARACAETRMQLVVQPCKKKKYCPTN